MGIVFRLFLAIAAFIFKFRRRLSPLKPHGQMSDGSDYFHTEVKDKKGNRLLYRVGVRLQAPILFRLHAESASDRWFKALGLAREFQTGDHTFDRGVYIASDHPALLDLLRENEKARKTIRKVLEAGYKRISTDGETLWIELATGRESPPNELALLAEIRDVFADIESRSRGISDPFAIRVLVVEALIWSVFAYACGAGAELLAELAMSANSPEGFPVHWWQLLGAGLLAGAILFGLLFGMAVAFLRSSSRGHRILLEAGVVLAIALPVVGLQTVSDLNRRLDSSEALVITRTIERRVTTRGAKGGTRYSLVLAPAAGSPEVDLPSELTVPIWMYTPAARGRKLVCHVGKGWLGIPWYRKVELGAK